MADKQVIFIDSVHPVLEQKLEQTGMVCLHHTKTNFETLQTILPEAYGIVIRSRFTIDSDFLKFCPNLKFIARSGSGLENIDTKACKDLGVRVYNSPEGNRNAVAEHALGMLLSLLHKIQKADKEVRLGEWNRESNRGEELDGKTVGIIGYGNMGKSFAKKLQGFNVTVLCYDLLANVGDANAQQVDLPTLQARADVLSLHVPWTSQTDKMIGTEFINQFAKPFWFINTSRGKNVVTKDLVTALKSGKILGAGLDVLEYEKLSFESLFTEDDRPEALEYLLQSEQVLLTPHIAGWTFESHAKLAQTIVDKIRMFYGQIEVESTAQPHVTGLGGFFFKSENPKLLKSWYATHLGLPVDDYGWSFWWKDSNGRDAMTQWSPFEAGTHYFDPSEKPYMINYRVDNLERLLQKLKQEGVTIVGEIETFEYGRFGWIMDPEGNKIELWEPIDSGFK